jgi:hypothetical protein
MVISCKAVKVFALTHGHQLQSDQHITSRDLSHLSRVGIRNGCLKPDGIPGIETLISAGGIENTGLSQNYVNKVE